jgi:hypothetical protein
MYTLYNPSHLELTSSIKRKDEVISKELNKVPTSMLADEQTDGYGKANMRIFAALRCENTKKKTYRSKNKLFTVTDGT